MAEYTIELRDAIKAYGNIFDFSYDFYDNKRKPEFERNFIRHFYFREICTEPIERFKLLLEDKMKTIFPYYNELFKTAAIEYSVLDNYDIRETTTLKRENEGASSGESFSVGKIQNEQETETNEDRTTNKVGEGNATTTKSRTETGSSETNRTATSDTERSETVNTTVDTDETLNGSKVRTGSETETGDSENIKKYLDTPQGQTNLSDSKYLTTLNHDTENHGNTKTFNDLTDTTNETKTVDGKTDTLTDGESHTETDETISKSDSLEIGDEETTKNTDEVDETETAKTTNKFTGEERTTADNNTRTRSKGSTTETIEHTRKGNIGVDTDADMIQKHIKLQKILTQIEKMFFDECEDLFMLVW